MIEPDYTGADLARWLQEVGRRRVARKPEPLPELIGAASAPVAADGASRRRYVQHPRELVLFAIAALAYMPYFFADVSLQISSLPCVIVFV